MSISQPHWLMLIVGKNTHYPLTGGHSSVDGTQHVTDCDSGE